MVRTAEAAGGVVHRERGFTWVASPAGAVLAFPEVSKERLAALFPQFLSAATRHGAREASCWSLLPTKPEELDAELGAAGFREGWQASWMAAELEPRPQLDPSVGVRVELAPPSWKATALPWDGDELARSEGCAYATLNATPDGELLYRTLGFRPVGIAQTWWMDLS